MLRTRITWLAAALVAGVVCSFVIPLALLMRTMAEENAIAQTRSDAQGVAMVVASVDDPDSLPTVLAPTLASRSAATTVAMPNGTVVHGADGGPRARASFPEDERLLVQSLAENRSLATIIDSRFHVLIPVAVRTGVAVVHSVTDLDHVHQGVLGSWAILGAVGLLMVVFSVLVARRHSDRISTPVVAMADVAHRLRSGDFAARATTQGPDEVVELGRALNQLADRIEELLRLEREGAADLSHRLRTPVTALRLDTDLVTDPLVHARLRGHVEDLHRAIDSVVADARRTSGHVLGGRADARTVLAARARHWTPLAEDQGRDFSVVGTEPSAGTVLVGSAPQDLADLVDNVVDNVFAHTPEGTAFGLELTVVDGYAVLRVQDAGSGRPETVMWERGESGAGSTGLGLDIVRKLAADAGGRIRLEASSMGGLSVVVTLPVVT